jgi:two-component system sensor histidine kinase DegS
MDESAFHENESSNGGWESFVDYCKSELERTNEQMSEIGLMIEQSQLEVNRLTQRNASATTKLSQTQSNIDSLPRSDIRSAYDDALDAQQRLFMMRGQLEKLQSDHEHIGQYKNLLDRILKIVTGTSLPHETPTAGLTTSSNTLEMMIQAQESERQRLARQMHDGPAQALSNFILQTEIAMRLFDMDQAKARGELNNLKTAAAATFQQVRDFIFELRPMMLDDLGLSPTLNRYSETFKEQHGIDIQVMLTGLEQRLEPHLEVVIFRAVQELLSNAVRYSQATLIKIQLDASELEVRVSVEDNGKGYELENLADEVGMGLKVIQDRVEMLGGDIEIHSTVGKGTHIKFQIPVQKTAVFA